MSSVLGVLDEKVIAFSFLEASSLRAHLKVKSFMTYILMTKLITSRDPIDRITASPGKMKRKLLQTTQNLPLTSNNMKL